MLDANTETVATAVAEAQETYRALLKLSIDCLATSKLN
jgi:hypothetical protein